MKFNAKYILIGLFTLVAFSCVDVSLPEADASFVIEKDTIINDKKARVEVTVADTINPVYFVYKGNAMHNSVWPGDREKATKTIRTESTKRPTSVTYYISHDYNSRKDSLLSAWSVAKKDTVKTQSAPLFTGLALATGSKEVAYTFKSKGNLIVTWVSVNVNERGQKETIKQKPIVVK